MPVPHVKAFSGALARKPFDERDPRAYDLFQPLKGDKLPTYGLIGVPFDGAVAGRKGCAQGPTAVREALRFASSYNFEDEVELHGMNAADLGDVELPANDTTQAHDRTTAAIKHLLENACHPLIIGGDNSLTYAGVRALAQSGAKKIGVLSLDAHLDVRVPSPDVTSGCPNYLILEKIPEVKAANMSIVGLRRFANSKTYRDWAQKKGIRMFPMKDIRRGGFQSILERAMQAATDGVEALYVSIDMDVVDQAWAPGVSSPSPDGLTPREVFDAVQLAAAQRGSRVFEVMETAPNLDPTGNTARVAATSILQYLVGRVKAPTMAPPRTSTMQRSAPPPRPMGGGRPFGGPKPGGRATPPSHRPTPSF